MLILIILKAKRSLSLNDFHSSSPLINIFTGVITQGIWFFFARYLIFLIHITIFDHCYLLFLLINSFVASRAPKQDVLEKLAKSVKRVALRGSRTFAAMGI